MSQYDPTFDFKINEGHCDLYFTSIDFALYLEDYLMYKHHSSGLLVSTTRRLTSKQMTVTVTYLYFMVH